MLRLICLNVCRGCVKLNLSAAHLKCHRTGPEPATWPWSGCGARVLRPSSRGSSTSCGARMQNENFISISMKMSPHINLSSITFDTLAVRLAIAIANAACYLFARDPDPPPPHPISRHSCSPLTFPRWHHAAAKKGQFRCTTIHKRITSAIWVGIIIRQQQLTLKESKQWHEKESNKKKNATKRK